MYNFVSYINISYNPRTITISPEIKDANLQRVFGMKPLPTILPIDMDIILNTKVKKTVI
jgi:hypothetical protein